MKKGDNMVKIHFVKKSKKEYIDSLTGEIIKAGESYYWWAFKQQPRKISKTSPKQSQLTQSEFWHTVYEIQEEIEDMTPDDTIIDQLDDIKDKIDSLRNETTSKLENMPDSLQDGLTIELLQSRVDSLQEWSDNLDDIDTNIGEELSTEKKEKRYQGILEEIQSQLYEGE